MGCIMMTGIPHHSAASKWEVAIKRTATGMRRANRVAGMPERTKPDPYNPDAIRSGIEEALKYRGETARSAAVGAEVAAKTISNLFLPPDHPDRTDTLRLDSVVRIAAYLRLRVSQFLGEEPLEEPATATAIPAGPPEQSSVYAAVLALQEKRIAQLEAALAAAAAEPDVPREQ